MINVEDIRNKLSPLSNIIAMLEDDINVVCESLPLLKIFNSELQQAKHSIKYLEDECNNFQKEKADLLNWAKSEMAHITNAKLAKRPTPYNTEKTRFLNRLIYFLE